MAVKNHYKSQVMKKELTLKEKIGEYATYAVAFIAGSAILGLIIHIALGHFSHWA